MAGSSRRSFADQAKSLYVHASHKGGMDNIDQEQISKIILQTAGGSSFTGHQVKLNAAVDRRVEALKAKQRKLDRTQRDASREAVAKRVAELEGRRDLHRVCVVVDFDMFYAAVAIRDQPHLADRPLAIGGALVLTANYVARRWGVRSGMPGFVAKELCRRGPEFNMPSVELTFVPADYAQYAQVAEEALEIYREYDPETSCGMGYDECSLDITEYLCRRVRYGSHALASFVGGAPAADEPPEDRRREQQQEEEDDDDDWHELHHGGARDGDDEDAVLLGEEDEAGGGGGGGQRRLLRLNLVEEQAAIQGALAEKMVEEIRSRVAEATRGLTVSAGIAPNFLLAKMGADVNKPNGQCRVQPSVEAVLGFLRGMPVRKVPYLGRVAEKICSEVLGVSTCGELLAASAEARCLFTRGRSDALLKACLGWDSSRKAASTLAAVEQKGISFSDTFKASDKPERLREMLRVMCDGLGKSMSAAKLRGTKLTLKLKESSFEVRSRAAPEGKPIGTTEELYARALPMLEREIRIGGGQLAAVLTGPHTHSARRGAAEAAAATAAKKDSSTTAASSSSSSSSGGPYGFMPLKLRSIGVQMSRLVREADAKRRGRKDHGSGADHSHSRPKTHHGAEVGSWTIGDLWSGVGEGLGERRAGEQEGEEGEEGEEVNDALAAEEAAAWLSDGAEEEEEEEEGEEGGEKDKKAAAAVRGGGGGGGFRFEAWDEWYEEEHGEEQEEEEGHREEEEHEMEEDEGEDAPEEDGEHPAPLRQRTLDGFIATAGAKSHAGSSRKNKGAAAAGAERRGAVAASEAEELGVATLAEMGFEPHAARAALKRGGGDMAVALEGLLR